jgi:hypothetical protein
MGQSGPTPEAESKKKCFALYNFEVLAEYHLPQEFIVSKSNDFLELFMNALQDSSVEVKVAALKAITSFLSSIEDTTVVLKYKALTEKLLAVVIEVLQKDEDKGRASLEVMIELTQTHGEIWEGQTSTLINVVSEVMRNTDFE